MANIHSISEKSWNEARRRGRAIGALYKKGLERTKADVIDAAKRLHLSVSHVYLLLKRYQANPKTSTLLPAKKGWITGKSRIAPAQEVVIQTVLDELYLTGERPGVSDIMDEIWRRCRKKGIPAPTEPTVRLRIARLDSRTVTKKREGARKAQEIYTPAGESPSCDHPLQIVQMDHTLVDLIIVDKVLRQPICRPWITLAIDVFTRMVLGFLLTLERPSTATCIDAFLYYSF